MTNSSDRIDRIETLLEQFISASVADRQASDQRMTRIEQSMAASDNRMTRIEERLGQITENQEATDAKVDLLVIAIDTLAVDVRRVVNYLEGQSGNGRRGD